MDDRSRYKPVSTAESFDPGVNADCVSLPLQTKPDVSSC